MIAKDFAQQLFNLQDRVAFVTGAGSGIGQMIAYGLASAGARVVCFDLREDGGLAETVKNIEAIGGEACFYTGDVRQLSDLRAGVALAKSRFGRLDNPLPLLGFHLQRRIGVGNPGGVDGYIEAAKAAFR